MLPTKYRAKRKDKPTEWVFGFYAEKPLMNKHFILQEEIQPYSSETILTEVEIIPQTLGQLRHINKHGEYYDGDLYTRKGMHWLIVSECCDIHQLIINGRTNEIGPIIGNIYDLKLIFNK